MNIGKRVDSQKRKRSAKPQNKQKDNFIMSYRPRSNYLGNPERQINYFSKVFTTDGVAIDKQVDDIEEVILKYKQKPQLPDKQVKIGIDLN